jgi:hypothetical protein
MKTAAFILSLLLSMLATAWAEDTKKPIDSLLGKCPPGSTWFDNHGECIPEGEITEIDGVPMDEIIKVLDAHSDELRVIKGVMGFGIDQHGIHMDVMPEHDTLPTILDGLPVHTHPYFVAVDS